MKAYVSVSMKKKIQFHVKVKGLYRPDDLSERALKASLALGHSRSITETSSIG